MEQEKTQKTERISKKMKAISCGTIASAIIGCSLLVNGGRIMNRTYRERSNLPKPVESQVVIVEREKEKKIWDIVSSGWGTSEELSEIEKKVSGILSEIYDIRQNPEYTQYRDEMKRYSNRIRELESQQEKDKLVGSLYLVAGLAGIFGSMTSHWIIDYFDKRRKSKCEK